jgi:hypothetical protein
MAASYGQPPYGPPSPSPAQVKPPARAGRQRLQNPILGGVVLGVGIVLLIAGAAARVDALTIIGLVAGAWGIWRVVTRLGNNSGPPGRNG